ncbi:outer membrane transport energization protein ExbD [Thalassolituus maritimus]|uniref:Outer membrane transport energization protein ExbD n=1 Tax=Thalassolituus maritimus TaxID=484498 RepID=A0A1N7IWZ3_9GAMM|nr:biopolymer transporter ExbD [Thalassolituus maritimus]SIS41600.1 outer membrane transport energization protein ExbD [Thalassolituus maritimus]
MQSRLQHRLEQQAPQGIDMSPLIDVVFILLIFFIVTTVFVRETGVEVDKPQAVSATTLEQSIILIAVTDSGEVIYDGSNIGIAGVRSVVSQAQQNGNQSSAAEGKPVVIQADRLVEAERLLAVIDEAKLAGAKHVSIAALKP